MYIVSFDVGICNLAYVVSCVDDWELTGIVECDNVDIRQMMHRNVSSQDCTLGHTRTATDWLGHFLQEREALFAMCEIVLVERQPLMGIQSVEQLLFSFFRDRVELISPNAMHKHFNISQYTYEGRKQQTVFIANSLIPSEFTAYHTMQRQHDVADALCIFLYWLHRQRAQAQTQHKEQQRKEQTDSLRAEIAQETDDPHLQFTLLMESYKYKP